MDELFSKLQQFPNVPLSQHSLCCSALVCSMGISSENSFRNQHQPPCAKIECPLEHEHISVVILTLLRRFCTVQLTMELSISEGKDNCSIFRLKQNRSKSRSFMAKSCSAALAMRAMQLSACTALCHEGAPEPRV